MLGRLLRQYRRLGLGMVLLTLLVWLQWMFVGIPEAENIPANAVGALALFLTMLIVVGAAILVLGIIAPGALPLVEILLLALLIAWPLTRLRIALDLTPFIDFAVIIAAIHLVERLMLGDWGAKIMRRDMSPKTTRFTVPLAPEDVWRRVVPHPDHAKSYFRPATDFLAPPEGSDADFVMHAKRRWGLKDSVEQVYIEASTPPAHVTYRSAPSLGTSLPGERVDIRLTPTDKGTKVELTVTFLQVSLGLRLRLWLGQDARDYAMSVRNRLLGRRDGTVHGRQIATA